MKARLGVAATVSRLGIAAILALAGALPASASEGGLPPLVHDIGIALFLSGFLAILFARIKFPAIAGYILGGHRRRARWPSDSSPTRPTSTPSPSLGFVLLLFVIGLEMNLGKIMQSGRPIIVTGALQYPADGDFRLPRRRSCWRSSGSARCSAAISAPSTSAS